jgi:hypothetical protein
MVGSGSFFFLLLLTFAFGQEALQNGFKHGPADARTVLKNCLEEL